MPPSQLKRLKASLREQGITGPQKSKKQKKQQRNGDKDEQRAQRHAALQGIRESFNPFEFKHLSRPKKFDYVTNKPAQKVVLGRPGVSKSQGEETRRKTLLPEMNRRNKVGGILDRRIGENDPTMTPDERMLARYTREQQRGRGAALFDLEEADDEEELTHGGRALQYDDDEEAEDYDAASVEGSSDEEGSRPLKRRRDLLEEIEALDGEADPDQPERKKSKAEVMKEVMAKSKLHKYERQQAKEEDEDLREELDKELPDILAAIRGNLTRPPPPPVQAVPEEAAPNDFKMNPARQALLDGKPIEQANREYDLELRQLALEQRSKPTDRTKTDAEKAEEEAARLKQLEDRRMKAMRGSPESDGEDAGQARNEEDQVTDDEFSDDAERFGLKSAAHQESPSDDALFSDEDDFLIEDDLIGSSDDDLESSEISDDDRSVADETMAEEADFLKDVLDSKAQNGTSKTLSISKAKTDESSKLRYTYPCPRSHAELLDALRGVEDAEVSTVIQRIRALYHAGLHADNKAKLADFSVSLVDHVAYMTSQEPSTPLTVVESVIRHIHSLSRQYPIQISDAFRVHLKRMASSDALSAGDLAILTAIGSIYPTSDHFHQIVTPAITIVARWLGLSSPKSSSDIAIGAFLGALIIKYQALSKRFMPEFMRYTLLALRSSHATLDLVEAHVKNLISAAELWQTKSAFIEIFSPQAVQVLKGLKQKQALQKLEILLGQAKLRRRPLELHHHRPLPIKTQIPKFEESYDPTKHYDPNRELAEANKLRKEYRRERKGALRELRKDASFIAREKLREKKEKDAAYEAKYKRLVAEIQGEEGHAKNEYEREKRARKRRG